MPIAGKPIYAGDINTLAQLDLQSTVAQDRATQEAIAGASRGIGNLNQSLQNKASNKLRQQELEMNQKRYENENAWHVEQNRINAERLNKDARDSEERYTYDSIVRGVQQGTISYDQLPDLAGQMTDQQRRSSLLSIHDSMKASEAQIEAELPDVVDSLNREFAGTNIQIARQRQKAVDSQRGWLGNPWGIGANKDAQANAMSMESELVAGKSEAFRQFLKDRPEYAGRIYLTQNPDGSIVAAIRPRSSGGTAPSNPLGQGQSTAPQTQPAPAPAPAPAPSPQRPSLDNPFPDYSGENAPLYDRNPAPMNVPFIPEGELMDTNPSTFTPPPQGVPITTPLNTSQPTVRDPYYAAQFGGGGFGVSEQLGVQSPTKGTTLDIVGVESDPVTGAEFGVDAAGNKIDLTQVLTPEIRNEFYSRWASLQRQGMSEPEARRRAMLWLGNRITSNGAR